MTQPASGQIPPADPGPLDPLVSAAAPRFDPGTTTSSSSTSGERRASAEKAVLDAADVNRVLDRMAHQILEKTAGGVGVVLLGIPTRGTYLADRLAERMVRFAQAPVGVGILDITLYRDDLQTRGNRPLTRTVAPSEGVDGKLVVLVDDVLFSGRTVRAALDALTDLGRPRAVQLAVLIDRGHRELPIRADYVGKNLPTARTENVRVRLAEYDDYDGVTIS